MDQKSDNQSLMSGQQSQLIDLLKNLVEYSVKYSSSKKELDQITNKWETFDQHNKDLTIKLKNVTFRLGKEVHKREELSKRRNYLRNSFNDFKEFIITELTTTPKKTRDKVLAFINKSPTALLCIPNMNEKGSQMCLIADFVPLTRPMIPQIIFHCCQEIERRGLQEEGIYRNYGSDKDIKQLKDRILKSRREIPPLDDIDIHVLCGVLKQFLRDLDEPIVTRILWRDFVWASVQENPEKERALIFKTLDELMTPNRDSLAFIMAHLNKVVAEEVNKMDKKILAIIFGPLIVGYSSLNLTNDQILAENVKQYDVMKALFRVPHLYWEEVQKADDIHKYSSPQTPNKSINCFSGTQKGLLTPMRNIPIMKDLSLKPMF